MSGCRRARSGATWVSRSARPARRAGRGPARASRSTHGLDERSSGRRRRRPGRPRRRRTRRPRPRRMSASTRPGRSVTAVERRRRCARHPAARRRGTRGRWRERSRRAPGRRARRRRAAGRASVTEASDDDRGGGVGRPPHGPQRGEPRPAADEEQRAGRARSTRSSRRSGRAARGCRRRRCRARGRSRPRRPATSCTVIVGGSPGPGRQRVAAGRLVAVGGGEPHVDVLAGDVARPGRHVEHEAAGVGGLLDDRRDHAPRARRGAPAGATGATRAGRRVPRWRRRQSPW